jgi:protein involved in polysaccharide export with SLBB domain
MKNTEASHCRRISPGFLVKRFIAATLAVALATRLISGTFLSVSDKSDYQIEPRDQIKFQVTGEADDPLVGRVSTAGEISIPLLGAVKIAGLSLRQAEDLMEKRYKAGGFFLNPQVILSFDSYAPRSVSVLGQVNNPSSVDFTIEREQMGIVSAITKAGGFTRVARPDSVKVTRNIDGKDTTFTVNVAAYLSQTSSDSEFKLMPDDIVFVPERVF